MLLHESSLAINFFITKHTERLTTLNLDKPVKVMITSQLNPPNVKNQPLALSIEHFGNSIIYSNTIYYVPSIMLGIPNTYINNTYPQEKHKCERGESHK